jgi:hypothetical protein
LKRGIGKRSFERRIALLGWSILV